MYWLLTVLHCTRPAAKAGSASSTIHSARNLIMPKRLYRIEPGGAGRRIESSHQADHDRKTYGAANEPERHIPEILRRETLPREIYSLAEVNGTSNQPSHEHA